MLYSFVLSNIIESLIIGIISSLIVSILFLWFILHKLRPVVQISNFICHSLEDYEINGINKVRNKYTFKLVNKSVYDTFDIILELLLLTPINHTGANSNLKSKTLSLRTSNMTHMSRFRKKNSKSDPFKKFAILIHTNEELEDFLKVPESFIQLRITARHGLSGLAKTFEQHFPDPSVIIKWHKFQHGEFCGTIPFNKTI